MAREAYVREDGRLAVRTTTPARREIPLYICVISDVDGSFLAQGEGSTDTEAYLAAIDLVDRYFSGRTVQRHYYVRMAL